MSRVAALEAELAALEAYVAALPKHTAYLREAILRISKTPVYEKRGKPASGISVALIAAISDAVHLAETGETCRHDFGMLGVCVRCGADERRLGLPGQHRNQT